MDKPIPNSKDIFLRDFRAKDFETLWQLDQLCFEPGIAYDKRSLRWFLREKDAFTIVAGGMNSEICGFILVHGLFPDGEREQTVANIITIDVHPTAQRSGLGSRLLNAAEDRAGMHGMHLVTLEVSVENHSAIAFYKRHGYTVTKRIEKYYNDKLDAFQMEKSLVGR